MHQRRQNRRGGECERGEPATRLTASWRFGLLGALAGLGAPLGALLLRSAVVRVSPFVIDDAGFFYLYMTVGTPAAFAAFGVVLGRLVEALQQSRESYRTLSHTDELTGLPNRRAFDAAYTREVARARRSGSPVACLALDIDRFKTFNDAYGHATGDEVLRALGRVLARVARLTDVPARIGGDEFAVLAPGATLEEARALARRIEQDLETETISGGGGTELHPTVTIGVAAGDESDADVNELLERADRALVALKSARATERRD